MKLIRNSLAIEQRVQVMGVLNVTPDSFSDGGRFVSVERAIERALEIEAQGADLLDIGGESTRPGSKPVTVEEELDRVLPVIDGLKGNLRIPISIDTTKHEVAVEAIAHGAELINDISGLRFDAELADVAAETGAALALMHSRGTPETMQKLPPVDDIFDEVIRMLSASIDEAVKRGVQRDKLIIDPGIGFGKTPEQNLQLIQGLDRLSGDFDLPALLGPSRKSFIPKTLDLYLAGFQRDDERERLAGTAAAVALGIERGARLIRVHDVIEMVAVVRLTEALMAV
ncbi:MAG: dihydropteroate synthase [Acidobacteria bacterium]|nr:dihydropteroate synthase [Acidobacteriota bacterium]